MSIVELLLTIILIGAMCIGFLLYAIHEIRKDDAENNTRPD